MNPNFEKKIIYKMVKTSCANQNEEIDSNKLLGRGYCL